MKKVYYEDFSDFNLDEFPYDKNHTALGEYHHFMPEGYMGKFYDPINNHQWRSMDGSWLISYYNNKKYLEQNRGYYQKGYFFDLTCLLVLNDEFLKNYNLETKLIMNSTKYYSGMAILYIHSRKYIGIRLNDNKIQIYYKNQKEEILIKERNFNYESLKEYKLNINVLNNNIKVYIDDYLYLDVNQKYLEKGKVAFMSQNSCRYEYLKIEMNEEEYQEYLNVKEEKERTLKEKENKYSKLKLIKKINLHKLGSGRQIRIAKNYKTNEYFFIFMQHQKKIMRDSYAEISCITAIDQEGNIMWQIGKPSYNLDNGLISCDLPIQVCDINNDGKDEIIYARNFEINIIDALTGKLIKKHQTPYVKNDSLFKEDYPFDYLNVDAIRVADFTKKGYKSDFIIKDRYNNVFAFDYNFNLLFRYNHKNTGHFPYVYDFDNDGKDELFIGYDYVKDGKVIWSMPYNSDHTDEIIYESLEEGKDKVFLLASGNEGFNIVDIKGNIIKSIPVGHAQRISLAKYDKNKDGYQICVTSFWGANGILYTFDKDLNIISEKEFVGNGNVITPVNYDNENILILSNTSSKYGGLLDVNLDVVVKFPDDNHPTISSECFDLDNDEIDEILTWDLDYLYIYKSSHIKNKDKIIKYKKYSRNSFSNYRGEFLIKL